MVGGDALHGGGRRLSWWGLAPPMVIHFIPICLFLEHFGPNKVLGMHLAPFLDEPSALEQKKIMLVPDAQC